MPVVTGVRERGGKAKVYVDGEFWAEIDAGVAAQRGLYKGLELSDDELAEVRVSGERALAMNRALHYLGYRARSAGEIRTRLRRYGYDEDIVGEIVSRLEELGYVDDREFARASAREKSRKYGPRRVSADLRKSGVDAKTAHEAIEEAFAGHSEREAAYRAASRRYNTEEGSDAQKRRVYGFLMRRGYSADVCAEIARGYGEQDSLEAGE